MNKRIVGLVWLALLFYFSAPNCGSPNTTDALEELRNLETQIWWQKQRLAMNEMRMIAAAVELYSTAHKTYPGPTDGLVSIGFIEADLKPSLLRRVRLRDPWGSSYLYWSDESSYLLVSTSANMEAERNYEYIVLTVTSDGTRNALETGASTDVDDDLVFLNGQFVGWFEVEE